MAEGINEPKKKTAEELKNELNAINIDDVMSETLGEEEPEEDQLEGEDEGTEPEDEPEEEGELSEPEESLEEDVKGKKIPLAKYVEEKKKRQQQEAEIQALKLQLQELQGDTEAREALEYKDKIKAKYIQKGYDEELSETLAEDMSELYKMAKKTQGKPAEVIDKYAVEISKLKSESDYYDNAESFSDKIKETMQAAEKAGLKVTAKQAYNMVVDPDLRRKEIAQRKLATGSTGKQTPNKAIPTSGGGKSTASAIKLSNADRAALEILQREYPNAGWNAEKFVKTKH